MSVWNAVMQACHSALIDELAAVYVDDKLELGLPKRMDRWGTTPETNLHLVQKLSTTEGEGVLVLGTRQPLSNKNVNPRAIFSGTVKRAQKEFRIRAIQATLTENKNVELGDEPSLRMIIWLPIRIVGKTTPEIFDLGVGI